MSYKNPEDQRKASRKHYENNKAEYMIKAKALTRAMAEYVNALKNVPCRDCHNEYPPYVMDFDHVDPETKCDTVSRLITLGSWIKLKTEIEKCDIVCSNCHRVRTELRRNKMDR